MLLNLKHTKLTLAISFFFVYSAAIAQQTDQVLAKFPNALAAFTNVAREVKITNKDGGLYIETTDEKEIIVLSDKASGIYNKGRVYHGSFDEVKLIEAYTKVPDGNKYKKINAQTSPNYVQGRVSHQHISTRFFAFHIAAIGFFF